MSPTVGSESDLEQLGGDAEVGGGLQGTRHGLRVAVADDRLRVHGPVRPRPPTAAAS